MLVNDTKICFYLLVSSLIALVAISAPVEAQTNSLARALESKHPIIRKVVDNAEQYELQLIFSAVSSLGGELALNTVVHKANADTYFYPASTVKLPMALMAAELVDQNAAIGLDTPYTLGSNTKTHTVRNDIRLIFAISDDAAYNRLYEWVGRDALNKRLREIGYLKTRIAHRLGTADADSAERMSLVFDTDQGLLTFQGNDLEIVALQLEGIEKGDGYTKQGRLIRKPFDFSRKNYFPLDEQHRLLAELVSGSTAGFNLGQQTRAFILKAMALSPRAAGLVNKIYYDSYVKFFLFGDSKKAMPEHIKIHNKVGFAYGTLTDNAYVVDDEYGIKFFLSGTLLVNRNRRFNDDSYEYDSVGIPFLAQLGREIYAIELAKRAAQ